MTVSSPTADVRRVHPDSRLRRLQATLESTQAALERNATMTAGIERTISELDAWLEAVTIDTDVATFATKRAQRDLLAIVLKRTQAARRPEEARRQTLTKEYEPIRETWLKLCSEYEALSDPTNPYTQRLTVGFVQARPAEIEAWLRTWTWEPAQPDTAEVPA